VAQISFENFFFGDFDGLDMANYPWEFVLGFLADPDVAIAELSGPSLSLDAGTILNTAFTGVLDYNIQLLPYYVPDWPDSTPNFIVDGYGDTAPYDLGSNFLLGTDITFDESMTPVSGTITALMFVNGIETFFGLEPDIIGFYDINLSVAQLVAAVSSGDPDANLKLTRSLLKGDDAIFGTEANDTLFSLGGNDTLYGNGGNDSIHGGSGSDTVSGGNGNDRIIGGSGDDFLVGGNGADRIVGGSGQDTIEGGLGRDVMFGGADSDIFMFVSTADSKVGASHDWIVGFETGVDLIDLSYIDADTTTANQQAFQWSETAAAHSVWTVISGSDLLVQADVNGDGIADMEILLRGVSTVQSSDFTLSLF